MSATPSFPTLGETPVPAYVLDEHGTALNVPIEDGHLRWFMGRLGDTAKTIAHHERRAEKAVEQRDSAIVEAARLGFDEREIAKFAKVPLREVRDLVAEYQNQRLWGQAS